MNLPYRFRLWAVFAAIVVSLATSGCGASYPAEARSRQAHSAVAGTRHRTGPLDVTFLVQSDTHFGGDLEAPWRGQPLGRGRRVEMLDLQRYIVAQANAMQGRSWPPDLGGEVGKPAFMLLAGDLTEDGDPQQWKQFVSVYGGPDKHALLHMPVEESVGNHDNRSGPYVAGEVTKRHGGVEYSVDWGDLHVVSLGDEPAEGTVEWLREDLKGLGADVPIVIFFHRPILGPYAGTGWFGVASNQEALYAAIRDHDVIAIFHGHIHRTGNYTWHGIPVYLPGSAKNESRSFLVAHITDDRLQVASWNYEMDGFWWWEQRPLGASKDVKLIVGQQAFGDRKPNVPYPTWQTQGL